MALYDDVTQNLMSQYGDQFGRYQDWQSRLFGQDQENAQRQQALGQLYGSNQLGYSQRQAQGANDLANYGITQGFTRDANLRQNGLGYDQTVGRNNLGYDQTVGSNNLQAQQAAAMYGLQAAQASGDSALAAQYASRLYGLQSADAGTARDQQVRDLGIRRGQELAVRQTPFIQRGLANSGFAQDATNLSNQTYGNAQGDVGTAYQQALAQAAYGRDSTTDFAAKQASDVGAMSGLRSSQAQADAAQGNMFAGQNRDQGNQFAGQDRAYSDWAANGRYDTGQQALGNDVNLANTMARQNMDLSNTQATADYSQWANQSQQGFDFWDRQSRDRNQAQGGLRAANMDQQHIRDLLNQIGGSYGF